ncbi:MAG TPA: hypothetical protein VIZ65_05885 [Cellvibrionaceae bacterium]
MNTYLFLAESILSITISLVVLSVLSRPLADVLSRMCADDRAVQFWVSYTKVMLVIAPWLLVLTVDLFAPVKDPLDALRLAIMAALAGMLFSLHLLGKRLSDFQAVPQLPESGL